MVKNLQNYFFVDGIYPRFQCKDIIDPGKYIDGNLLSCTCHRHVSKMSMKCQNVEYSQKIVLFYNILSNTDTKFTCQSHVRWGIDRPTFMKLNKSFSLQANF